MFGYHLDNEHTFGHHGSMKRTYVRRRRAVAAVIAIALGGALLGPVAGAVAGQRTEPAKARTYVVVPGDTLWAIASRLRPGSDPRPVIQQIQEANGVDAGALVPGQSLVIPTAG